MKGKENGYWDDIGDMDDYFLNEDDDEEDSESEWEDEGARK